MATVEDWRETHFSLKVYLNTSFASIRDFFWFKLWNNDKTDARIAAEGYKGNAGARIHWRDHSRWSRPFSAFVLSPVFILFTECLNPLLLLPCHYLFEPPHFSVTLHVPFIIIIFSPSLSRPTSLPPGSLLTISLQNYLSVLCTCHQKRLPFPPDTERLGELGRLLSVPACVEIHRCSVCAGHISSDRCWVNMT